LERKSDSIQSKEMVTVTARITVKVRITVRVRVMVMVTVTVTVTVRVIVTVTVTVRVAATVTVMVGVMVMVMVRVRVKIGEEGHMSNLDLWDKVCVTDPRHTKKAKIGQMNITAIDPQYQRKAATEVFGAYGLGWGISTESEKIEFLTLGDTTLATYTAVMYYKLDTSVGAFPICSNLKVAYVTQGGKGYLKVDDDYAKKLQTDALTKGLSFLGFNSDVFEGLYDDNKYVQKITQEFAKGEQAQKAADYFKPLIDEDSIEETHQRIKDGWKRLDQDQQKEVYGLLHDKAPDSKRKYKTLLDEHLSYVGEEI